ncbi:MAG: hypothetical protein U5J64_11985 [Halobacteriales archaeon]|nr:hypothetical protein [Halobacteriales archaeon]
MGMELPETKWIIVGVAALLIVAAFVTGFFVAASQTSLEATVVTSQSGEAPLPGDEIVLVGVGEESRLSESVAAGVERGLTEEGYTVTMDEEMADDYDSPVLLVEVTDETVDRGPTRHTADVSVMSYYSTTGNTTGYEEFKETRSTVHREDGAVVVGEYRLRDTTDGFVTSRGYTRRIADDIAEEVVSSFRGATEDG